MDMYRGLFLSVKEQPNLGYAVVKLDFACMHLVGWDYMPSLCVNYDMHLSIWYPVGPACLYQVAMLSVYFS